MSFEKVSQQQLNNQKADLKAEISDLSNLSTTDKSSVVAAVNELFTSAGNGKTAIAAAITGKGVPTAASDSFATMAQNIENIETGITPSGTKNISANGTYDVTQYASAHVNVGSQTSTLIAKTVTANGTYNASSDNADGYSSVTVNIPTGSHNSKCFVITLESDGVNGINNLTPPDSDIAAHRNDSTMVVSVMRISPAVSGQKSLIASICGNNLLATDYVQEPYGVLLRSTASAVGTAHVNRPINSVAGLAGNIYVDEYGGIGIYATTAYYPLIAGTYVVTCGW